MEFKNLSHDGQRALLAAVAAAQMEGRKVGIVILPSDPSKPQFLTTAPAPNTKQ